MSWALLLIGWLVGVWVAAVVLPSQLCSLDQDQPKDAADRP